MLGNINKSVFFIFIKNDSNFIFHSVFRFKMVFCNLSLGFQSFKSINISKDSLCLNNRFGFCVNWLIWRTFSDQSILSTY